MNITMSSAPSRFFFYNMKITNLVEKDRSVGIILVTEDAANKAGKTGQKH